MDDSALVARLVLVLVFGTAGAAKLLNLEGTRDTLEAFGLPYRLAVIGSRLLPIAEVGTALALMIEPAARGGAIAALALLIVFSGGVGATLARGQTPNCNCFGQFASERISVRTLLRNLAFSLLAGFAIWKGPGTSLSRWTNDPRTGSLIGALAVMAAGFLAVVTLGLWQMRRSSTPQQAAADHPRELGVGDPAPRFTLSDLGGTLRSLDLLLERNVPVLLVFASPACGPCAALLPKLAQWTASLSASLTIVVVESGIPNSTQFVDEFGTYPGLALLIEPGLELAMQYGVGRTPTAFLLDADGVIKTGATSGATPIERLVRDALRDQSPASVAAG
jgi:uncharacterized membrane protein YphA (DoxX/SURF4 family)/peroxiredoxin